MTLGVHVSIAGGLLEAVARAQRLACTTMQIFSRSPRGGAATVRSAQDLASFDAARQSAGIAPLAVHAPYIINLASPQPQMWAQSLRLYSEECARAAQLNAEYLVTHVGSHRGDGETDGIARVAAAVTQALEQHPSKVMILLENTAGAGQGLGYNFEQLAAIRNAVRTKARVGMCLDTAHLFAAGFPIHTEEGLEQTLEAFDRVIGLAHLKLLHLNDSKVPFHSRVDRHWHIGEGHIGVEAFRRIVNHPRLSELPFILETPKTTEQEDQRNLATVRNLRRVSRARNARAVLA
jgi:deoxyribonuclease-4